MLQAEHAHRLTVDGLVFDQANTSITYRHGAVKIVGSHNMLRNLTVQNMDAVCVQVIGSYNTLADSVIQHCGQLGIHARGQRIAIVRNRVRGNNCRGFNRNWEAGGRKFIGEGGLHDSVVANNTVVYNHGDGIWFDTGNADVAVIANVSAYNAGFGLHYETSARAAITGNWVYGNLRGIYLTESPGSLVQGNSVFANTYEGIAIVDGPRSALDPALRPVGNRVLNNAIAWNDQGRNWIQLVLPGRDYGAASDYNLFLAEGLDPRLSMGFMSSTNYPFERLAWWQSSTKLDAHSSAVKVPMPAALRQLLDAKVMLWPANLPAYLLKPPV